MRIACEHGGREDERRRAPQLDRLLLAGGGLERRPRLRPEEAEPPGLRQVVVGRVARQVDELPHHGLVDRLRAVLLVCPPPADGLL